MFDFDQNLHRTHQNTGKILLFKGLSEPPPIPVTEPPPIKKRQAPPPFVPTMGNPGGGWWWVGGGAAEFSIDCTYDELQEQFGF